MKCVGYIIEKKYKWSVILSLLFCGLVLSSYAYGRDTLRVPACEGRITDATGLLNEEQRLSLTWRLDTLSMLFPLDLYVLVTPNYGGVSSAEYAANVAKTWGLKSGGEYCQTLLMVLKPSSLPPKHIPLPYKDYKVRKATASYLRFRAEEVENHRNGRTPYSNWTKEMEDVKQELCDAFRFELGQASYDSVMRYKYVDSLAYDTLSGYVHFVGNTKRDALEPWHASYLLSDYGALNLSIYRVDQAVRHVSLGLAAVSVGVQLYEKDIRDSSRSYATFSLSCRRWHDNLFTILLALLFLLVPGVVVAYFWCSGEFLARRVTHEIAGCSYIDYLRYTYMERCVRCSKYYWMTICIVPLIFLLVFSLNSRRGGRGGNVGNRIVGGLSAGAAAGVAGAWARNRFSQRRGYGTLREGEEERNRAYERYLNEVGEDDGRFDEWYVTHREG